MKKTKLIIVGGMIASTLITASVFAATPTSYARHQGTWSFSGSLNRINKANVTRTVTNITNGIQITETSSDAGTLAALNAKLSQAPRNNNPLVTITQTAITNGIQTTMTSTDAATVAKLQASGGKNGGNMDKKWEGQKSGSGNENSVNMANVTRTVTNIANGVQIVQTTTDSATLAKLNAMLNYTPKFTNPKFTTTKVAVTNGIQTTITSTDPTIVAQLQANGGKLSSLGTNNNQKQKTVTKKVIKKTTKTHKKSTKK